MDGFHEVLTPTPGENTPVIMTTPPPGEEEEHDGSHSPVVNGDIPTDSPSTLRGNSAAGADSFERSTPSLSGKVRVLHHSGGSVV